MNWMFASEVLNGNWAILCIVLLVVCVCYLVDESVAHHKKWTIGMRAAFALLVLTIGIGTLRISEYVGWHLFGDIYHPNMMPWRMIGGTVGTIGFLVAIKEFSSRLYGDLPWIVAVALCIGFTIFEIVAA